MIEEPIMGGAKRTLDEISLNEDDATMRDSSKPTISTSRDETVSNGNKTLTNDGDAEPMVRRFNHTYFYISCQLLLICVRVYYLF